MNFALHPEAESEFYQTVNYLEDCEPGIGKDFAQDVFSTISRITEFPFAWSPLHKNIRRCLCKRFPYGLIYEVHADEIMILAIMHQNREPDYWLSRKA